MSVAPGGHVGCVERYRVSLNTAKPSSGGQAPVGSRSYRVVTAAGPHAAVALGVAAHNRKRPLWPLYGPVAVARTLGFLRARVVPETGSADPYVEASQRFLVAFETGSVTVATWLGDFKAVAIAVDALFADAPAATLESVVVTHVGDGPALGDGFADDLADWYYEWR
jgi:hypothetical protein